MFDTKCEVLRTSLYEPKTSLAMLLVLLLVGCTATSDSVDEAALPSQLSVAITPGKPDAPTERVEINRTVEGCAVTVERLEAGGTAIDGPTRIDLGPDRSAPCDEVFDHAEQIDLLTFEPTQRAGEEFDAATFDLTIEHEAATHMIGWVGTLERQDEIDELLRLVAALAVDESGQPILFYFPTPR